MLKRDKNTAYARVECKDRYKCDIDPNQVVTFKGKLLKYKDLHPKYSQNVSTVKLRRKCATNGKNNVEHLK